MGKKVIHKIIDMKKIMLPENIECNSQANCVVGNKDWRYVTCSRCLKHKKATADNKN